MAITTEQKNFIERIGRIASADMKNSGVLASLTIAQAILESGWGKSGLTVKANALFGIKAGSSWKGRVYSCSTKECYDGVSYTTITDAFRAYGSWEESIADHSAFLTGLSRYKAVVGETNYIKACIAIKAAGYATEPDYSNMLIRIIESYGLTAYDTAQVSKQETQSITAASFKAGDVVQFTGGNVYVSSCAVTAAVKKPASCCKITQIYNGKHPYHLVSQDSKGIYGWVDAVCVKR